VDEARVDDQLIKLAALLNDLHQSLIVCAAYVASLTSHMLRIWNASYFLIVLRAAKSAVHHDRAP
jgi:hypothetical protein